MEPVFPSTRADQAREFFTLAVPGNYPCEDASAEALSTPFGSFIAVLDGHTGRQCAQFARENLIGNVQRELQIMYSRFQEALRTTASLRGARVRVARAWDDALVEELVHMGMSHKEIGRLCPLNSIPTALRKAFLQTDRDFFLECTTDTGKAHGAVSGSCALMAAFIGPALFVANAGDSRCVVGRRGRDEMSWEPFEMSREHTATNPAEVARIMKEHPEEPDAIVDGRIKGRLQPSRCLGDGPYKNAMFNKMLAKESRFSEPYTPPYVTAEPEVKAKLLDPSDAFVIVATDGLWDRVNSSEAVGVVGAWIDRGCSGEDPASLLVRRALEKSPRTATQDRRSLHDGITVTIAMLHDGCPRVTTDVLTPQCLPEVMPPCRVRLDALLSAMSPRRSSAPPPPPPPLPAMHRPRHSLPSTGSYISTTP